MNIQKFPPPRRFVVEVDTDDDGYEFVKVIECTGEEDPVYIVGHESPWLGISLEDVEKYARENEYDPHSDQVLEQCLLIRGKK